MSKKERAERIRKGNLYLEERKILLGKQSTNIQEFDRSMITVSTFSLGYVLAQVNTYNNILIFVIHSAIFLLCVIFTMVSCILGNKAIDKQLEINYEYYIEDDEKAIDRVPCEEKIMIVLSKVTLILFLIGLILAIFVSARTNSSGGNSG